MYGRRNSWSAWTSPNFRGRGGGSGRGYGGGERNQQSQDFGFNNEVGENATSGAGSSRHPRGLKGREIGLWYAHRSRGKKGRGESRQRVDLNQSKTKEIESLLQKISNDEEAKNASAKPNTLFECNYHLHQLKSQLKEKGETETYDRDIDGLARDSQLDERLRKEAMDKKSSAAFKHMFEMRQQLPAYAKRKELLEVIAKNQIVVVSGETGCGKTTQVPQYILEDHIDSGDGSLCHIVCTQPRRISAITVAERVAEERNESCGDFQSVGYHIRLEKKLCRTQGSIVFCTTGTVIKYLESDQFLSRTSHVIIDEIHERDLQSDFLLIIMKDILKQRSDLKLILMSATLDAEKFSKYYGKCPMLNIPGFTYPVKEYFLEDVLELVKFKFFPPLNKESWQKRKKRQSRKTSEEDAYEKMKATYERTLIGRYSHETITSLQNYEEDVININLIYRLLKHICQNEPEGGILVFLPGWDDISKVNNLLQEDGYFSTGNCRILPLHSLMPTVNQRDVFQRPPKGVRKIILSTNIAETSITINDIVYVVDCGRIKLTTFDAKCNVVALKSEWVSLANAHQRRGRAGRVQPGVCYHLYTKLRESLLNSYQLPEMLRIRLEEVILQIKMLNLGKVEPFISRAMDPPPPDILALSFKVLLAMNALDSEENLTPLGYHLAKLPVDIQTGKMLLFGAIFSCLDPILTVAASLSFKDAFMIPLGKEKQADEVRFQLSKGSKSDHITLVNAYDGWIKAKQVHNEGRYCFENFLSISTLSMLQKMKTQLAEHLHDVKLINTSNPNDYTSNRNSKNIPLVRAIICAGLYPNVAKVNIKPRPGGYVTNVRKKRPNKAFTKEDGRVSLHLKSVNALETNFESPWLVYHLKMKSASGISLHDTSMVPAYPLIFFGGQVKFTKDAGVETMIVDDFIKFHCTENTALLVQKLRKQLDELLDYKISRPGATNWDQHTQEGALMKAISDLIISEEILTEPFFEEKVRKKFRIETNYDRDDDGSEISSE